MCAFVCPCVCVGVCVWEGGGEREGLPLSLSPLFTYNNTRSHAHTNENATLSTHNKQHNTPQYTTQQTTQHNTQHNSKRNKTKKDVESVGLWLGAGVMCEYPLDEAVSLLRSNKEACEANLKAASDNLGLLKDSITVTEVNTARVFNWDVEQRRHGRKGA